METRSLPIFSWYTSFTVGITLLLFTACTPPEKDFGVQAAPVEAMIATTVDDDTRVIISLVAFHNEDIILSQLALQKSANKDVMALARMMEGAHTRNRAELTKLAVDLKLDIPATLNEKAEESKAELNKLSGKDFDLAYCQMMVESHGRSIARMEGAAENATDANLRGWITRTLPQMHHHKEEALACQKKCEEAHS